MTPPLLVPPALWDAARMKVVVLLVAVGVNTSLFSVEMRLAGLAVRAHSCRCRSW